jgi:pimeloyl-ACP methyl ester carboxylesterase
MKKCFVLFALLQFFFFPGFSQDDFEKMMVEFEKMANDPKSIYGKNKAVGKYYNIRGIKMYTEAYGQGHPLLFIHGNGGSGGNFFKQVPYFSKKYKVIIADSRAQGKSADRDDSLSYEMMADDYAALLDAMKIDSAYVVGWSDGGINGLLMAIRHPQKVKKLAITGANLRPDNSAIPQELLDILVPVYDGLKNKTDKNEMENAGYKLVKLLIEQPHIPLTDLQKISCPTLVIGGDHDVIKEEHTMEIYKNIPKAYLWILPNSGHSTPIKYADEFNRKISEFFSKPYRQFEIGDKLF